MIVVSNTSPITHLAAIGQFGLLEHLYGEIHVPSAVVAELNAGGRVWPGKEELDSASWAQRHEVANANLAKALGQSLGAGESEAIALALELGADLIILDDGDGRRAASGLGLKVVGVVGVLVEAKAAGRIERIAPLLADLRREAGFYLSRALELKVLEIAGETSG